MNANIPYVQWLTGYLDIAVGYEVTMTLPSSLVLTSALTPLAAKVYLVPRLTGYVAIAVGCGVTMMIQSSLVFTSALKPLAGKVTK